MKYLFSIILALLSMNAAAADTGDLTFIDWERLPIDSVLPLYTEVVPLETDYRSNTYTVSVEFPEWKPVSAREREVLDLRFASEIADTLEISATVGVSRRQGMLDIAFVPIVRTGKTYQKLISGKIVITAHPKAKAKKPSILLGKAIVPPSGGKQGGLGLGGSRGAAPTLFSPLAAG